MMYAMKQMYQQIVKEELYIMAVMMSHPINDQIKEAVEEEVNNMPALELLNKCDELGIKTSELPMEELMDQLHDALVEQRMQP